MKSLPTCTTIPEVVEANVAYQLASVMIKSLQIVAMATHLAFISTPAAAAEKESAQVAAVRSMHSVLAAGKYQEFYRDWCHPHLQRQLGAKEFAEWMKSDKGKAVVRLYASVIGAIDTKAGSDTLIARAEEQKDKYEFILVATGKQNAADRAGAQWHLEIQLHEGKWKLMDTD